MKTELFKRNGKRTALICGLAIALLANVSGQNQLSEKVDYFADNGFGNAVWGKAGEHYKGITYVTYQGPLEDPYVAGYDHANEKWIGPYKAGTSLLGKDPNRKIDNHGKPTLVVDSEGYIHIVFGGHGATPDFGKNPFGNYHLGKQIHVVSKNPMDISSWEEVENIPVFGTYSQFLKMQNGDIYLFYRHGAHRSNWVYQISKDNCRTFSPPVSIIISKTTNGTIENPDIWDSWYLNFNHGKGNDIIVAFNYHVCKEPHHNGERHNSYYMKFDTDNQQWLNVKGETMTLPITKEQADAMTLVNNTGANWTHNGMASLDDQGHPHVTSHEGEDDGTVHGGPKQTIHYYWTGTEWVIQDIDLLPVQPKMVRNARSDAHTIVSEKRKGSDFTNMYLIGDSGPIQRIKAEADWLSEAEKTMPKRGK